jgi:hypothetical protein
MTDHAPFRALDMLLTEYPPLLRRRSPYWAPPPAKCWQDIHVPAWDWYHVSYSPAAGHDVTHIDTIASYVSAASSAQYAHGALERTGALPGDTKRPGYYLVDAHPWQDDRIVSPLGTADLPSRVWVAYPTLELLQRLAGSQEGYWPDVAIHDSWTCTEAVRLRPWATAVNTIRAEAWRAYELTLVDGSETEQADAHHYYDKVIKAGYAMAFQLMLGTQRGEDRKSKIRRPDWWHTTVAQAAANVWRTTFRAVEAGYIPCFMGSKDEVAWLTEDLLSMVSLERDRPLIKMDGSGVALGHWKVKTRSVYTPATAS